MKERKKTVRKLSVLVLCVALIFFIYCECISGSRSRKGNQIRLDQF